MEITNRKHFVLCFILLIVLSVIGLFLFVFREDPGGKENVSDVV